MKPYGILQVKNALAQPVYYVKEHTGPTFLKKLRNKIHKCILRDWFCVRRPTKSCWRQANI
jgi:hypothetical protein